ncbi:MAG: hypothetical protein OEY12_18105, partial [Nitrospira sp.]|nr:hypothetical protein [Nitrospira sp.]
MQELPCGGRAGMGDQINLQIAGLGHVPVVRLDRDELFEQRAGARGPVEPSLQPVLARLQPP